MIQLPSNIESPWYFILFSGLLLIQILLFLRHLYWYNKSRNWVKLKAKILESDFQKASLANETVDTVKILYCYEVGGKEFKNDKIVITDYSCSWLISPSKKITNRINMQRKNNYQIIIFSSKENPNLSVINNEFDNRIVIFSGIFSMFFVFMILEALGVYKFSFL